MLVGALLSFLGGYFLTMWVENIRAPKLTFSEGTVYDMDPIPNMGLNEPLRFLRIRVANELPSQTVGWIQRAAAVDAIAELTFHLPDGRQIIDDPMEGRWSRSDQPVPMSLRDKVDDKGELPEIGLIFDTNVMLRRSTITIYPGEREQLDIVTRLPSSKWCRGWSNRSYHHAFQDNGWRLGTGIYLIRVNVRTAGRDCVAYFRVNNSSDFNDFEVTPASEEEADLVEMHLGESQQRREIRLLTTPLNPIAPTRIPRRR